MSNELTTVQDADCPDFTVMERADLPAIWNPFREQALKLKATAETLTITSVDQKSEMAIARTTRLALRQIRTAVEHKRVELKEDALKRGKQIDAAANELKALIEPLEDRLKEQEEFAVRLEAKRRADLVAERSAKLIALDVNPQYLNLGPMPDAEFEQLLANSQAAHDAKIAATAKAEAERIAKEKAEIEERERIQQENIRLRADAEERERLAKIEREKIEAERREVAAAAEKERLRVETEKREASEKARQEREAIERKAAQERETADRKAAAELAAQRAEADRQAAERERADSIERARIQRIAEIERQAREKAEKELAAAQKAEADKRAKEEAERKTAEKASKAAAKAPDKIKLKGFASMVRLLTVPDLTTLEGAAIGKEVSDAIAKLATWIEGKAAEL